MTSPTLWSLIMDAVVAGLLVATMAYAIRLNRQLVALRRDREHLAELITGLQVATQQADRAVRELKLIAAESSGEVQAVIGRAITVKDDLTFLIGKGEAMADRLETGVTRRPDPGISPVAATPRAPRAPVPRAEPIPPADHRLAALLRQTPDDPPTRIEPTLGSSAAGPASDSPTAERPRSRSERELQRALQGRR